MAIANSANFSRIDIGILVKVFSFMKYEDEKLWANLAAASNKLLQLLRGKSYGIIFNHFLLNPTHSTSDFRERLISLLPTKVYKMPRDELTKSFVTLVKLGRLNEYLWDKHFQKIFVKRAHWFGPKNYKLIIDHLVETEFAVTHMHFEFICFNKLCLE